MHSASRFLALTTAALISSTTSASPFQPRATNTSSSPLQTNNISCSDVSTGLAPACWFALNMTTYLDNWVATSPYNDAATDETPGSTGPSTSTSTTQTSNNTSADDVTTGTNSSSYFRERSAARTVASASGRCEGGKPFSTCFLQLQQGYVPGKSNCSKINTAGANGTCPAPRVADYANNPQAFYAAWNIYSINAYLSTFHLALSTLAHSHPSILSAAATHPAPGLPRQTLPTAAVPLLTLLLRSTGGRGAPPGGQNAPFVSLLEARVREGGEEAVYGAGTTPPGRLAALMQGSLEAVLGAVMGDERVFVRVAGNGAFSTGRVGSVEGLVRGLGG